MRSCSRARRASRSPIRGSSPPRFARVRSTAATTLHVGDSERLDRRAALAAGLCALRLDRGGVPDRHVIASLEELPDRIRARTTRCLWTPHPRRGLRDEAQCLWASSSARRWTVARPGPVCRVRARAESDPARASYHRPGERHPRLDDSPTMTGTGPAGRPPPPSAAAPRRSRHGALLFVTLPAGSPAAPARNPATVRRLVGVARGRRGAGVRCDRAWARRRAGSFRWAARASTPSPRSSLRLVLGRDVRHVVRVVADPRGVPPNDDVRRRGSGHAREQDDHAEQSAVDAWSNLRGFRIGGSPAGGQ